MNFLSTNKLQQGFGQRLRDERVRLTFTQDQLAEKLNVKQQTIYKYEKNITAPDTTVLYDLLELGFDISYLVLGHRQIENVREIPVDVLKTIAKMIGELEAKFPAGSLSDAGRVNMTMIFVEHYLNSPNGGSIEDKAALQLLMGI